MKHSILLFGANGQVGHALQTSLSRLGEVMACTRDQIDFSQSPEAIVAALKLLTQQYQPTMVVNATAYTAVDRAQAEPDIAQRINATAPGLIAKAAQDAGACVVHFSTDYVFKGDKPEPYVETDPTDPQSVYGHSKLAGERAVASACARHLIFRTSWVLSAHGGNFLKTMLKLAQERDALNVVSDQVGAPTSANLLATVTTQILHSLVEQPSTDPRWGLYHLVASGQTNWHAYACYVIAQARAAGWPIKIQDQAIHPIATKDYPVAAPRPLNSRLDTLKLCQAFNLTLPEWRVGVDEVLQALKSPA
ncbi:MAG: dTDP-4-dehydrorhamnose reductase [Alcaligenaceae bacterium]